MGGSDASMDGPAKVEVFAAMDRLNRLLASKDPALAEEFASVPDVRLVGSEAGEIAEGPEAIAALVRRLHALPMTLRWDWSRQSVSTVGAIAWVFADGHLVIDRGGEVERAPYTMTGVLQRLGTRWLWRQFHGSEPAIRPTSPSDDELAAT